MAEPLQIADLEPWIDYRFSRSSGPGGQHVNKTSSRVSLRFDFETCPKLSDWQKTRIRQRLGRYLNAEGHLQITRQDARSQHANRQTAQEHLLNLLEQAQRVRKRRRPTRPTAASKRRRVDQKKQRGAIKRLRQKPPTRD